LALADKAEAKGAGGVGGVERKSEWKSGKAGRLQ